MKIVAKIEKPQAVANLDAIVAEADAVMVARGDLGVELDVAKVPAIQKRDRFPAQNTMRNPSWTLRGAYDRFVLDVGCVYCRLDSFVT